MQQLGGVFTFREKCCKISEKAVICMNPYDPKRPLYENGDSSYRKNTQSDPYERGFADRLYDEDEPVFAEPEWEEPEAWAQEAPPEQPRRKRKKHRFRRFLLKLLLLLLALVIVTLAALHFLAKQPAAQAAAHRDGSSTILLAGTDASGDRTDTLMLLNVNRDTRRLSLLSIPRDTRVNCTYSPQKINGAYGVNGGGTEGMESLMGYVEDCVGFRPDGYVLIEMEVFVELVDLFGGVEFDVPMDMDYDDPWQGLSIHLQKGLQTLDGGQAMGLVRFRSGYAMADLERVNVQRRFVSAAIDQWSSPKYFFRYFRALSLVTDRMLTDLSKRELVWLAESAALCGVDDLMTATVPYYLGEVYVYIDGDGEYLDLINTYFNPYTRQVTLDDLNLAYQ